MATSVGGRAQRESLWKILSVSVVILSSILEKSEWAEECQAETLLDVNHDRIKKANNCFI
jgi:hypothetical protein